MRTLLLVLSLFAGAFAGAIDAPAAADENVYILTIEDHRFTPDEIKVPAGKRLVLVVRNRDRTVEEFESRDLRVEKIVAGGKEITLKVGPLKPGRYTFIGEFNLETAKGVLIAE